MKEQKGIRQVTERRNGAELNEFAESKLRVVKASFNDVGVDLFEGLDGFAFGEEGERWMALEELVRRV